MLVQPGNRSVRSCVRACEAACACETMLLPWLADFSVPAPARVPFPAVGVPCLAVASRRFPWLLGGFPLLPVASRCFPWLPVASRARFRCLLMLIYASGHRSRWVPCCWLLIAVNRCKSLLNAFPLLPVASCCFPLLPVASRARFRCESVLIYASGHRSRWVACCWLLIAVNRCKSLLNAFQIGRASCRERV